MKFRFEADEEDFSNHNVRFKNKTLRTPIGLFPQRSKIKSFFGSTIDFFKESRLQSFKVIISYEDMEGGEYEEEYPLDVSQFDGFSTIGNTAEHDIAESLKKIENHLRKTVSASGRINVTTMTPAQIKEEREREIEQMKKNDLL